MAVSNFAEACLRAHESGLEGISIYSEVSSRTLAAQLNYLALRHWTYHPVSSLDAFAVAELAPRLGGDKEALDFAEALCRLDEGQEAGSIAGTYELDTAPYNQPARGDSVANRMWYELLLWDRMRAVPTPLRGFTDVV